MYTISGSGNRQSIGLASYLRAIVGAVTDPYADYIVYDTFTDANGTNLTAHTPEKAPAAWVDYNNAPWTISSNKALTPNFAGRQNMGINCADADVIITGDCLASQTALTSRLSDSTHMCFCHAHATADQLRLYTDNAGFAVIGSTAHVYTAGDPVSFVYTLSGNSHTVVEGGDTAVATSAFNNTATIHGLWSNSPTGTWTVDNLTIAAV